MTTPTERPEERGYDDPGPIIGAAKRLDAEERDSLAEIEERLVKAEQSPFTPSPPSWRDIRTLINELTELREEKKLATQQAVDAINRKVTVENDLAELRERASTEITRLAELVSERGQRITELRERNEELERTVESYIASGPTTPEARAFATEEHNRAYALEQALREAYDYLGEIGHGIPQSVAQALTQGTEKP